MPSFGLVVSSKPEPSQRAERSCRLCEIKLRLDGDCGLGIFTMSKRDQAGALRLGEDKVSSVGHAAALRLIRSAQYALKRLIALGRYGSFPQEGYSPT